MCTSECYWKYEVKMTRILYKVIIYPSCERAFKNGRVKSKIVKKSSFSDRIFLASHDYIWFLFICFLYCAKQGVVFKMSKVSCWLKNSLSYAKEVENERINFSVSPYCTLLFSRKENFNFLEAALSAFLWNGAVGCIMNVWGYQRWIPHWTFTCFLKSAIKALKQGVKFV